MVRKTMYYWDDSMHLNGILHDKLVICLTFYFFCIFVWLCFFFVSFKCFSSQPMCEIKQYFLFFFNLLQLWWMIFVSHIWKFVLHALTTDLRRGSVITFWNSIVCQNICFGSAEIESIPCGIRSMTYSALPVHHLKSHKLHFMRKSWNSKMCIMNCSWKLWKMK